MNQTSEDGDTRTCFALTELTASNTDLLCFLTKIPPLNSPMAASYPLKIQYKYTIIYSKKGSK